MSKAATLTVQMWGNSLALRIPSTIAKEAKFSVGQPVEIAVDGEGLTIRNTGKPKLSLAQKLAAFDPSRHSGEVMISGRVGVEA